MQARIISTPTKRKNGLLAHQEIVRGTYYILVAFIIQVALGSYNFVVLHGSSIVARASIIEGGATSQLAGLPSPVSVGGGP